MPAQESSRLIKARTARNLGGAATFNFDDLRRQCDEYVELARRQGEERLAAAKAEAEEIRRQAHAEGVAAGQREGLASARHLVEARAAEIASQLTQERLKTVLPAFQAAARALEIERDRWLAAWETAAVRLSAAIAEKILRRELDRRPELALPMIREALQLAGGQPQIRLHVHPRDLEQLQLAGEEALRSLAPAGDATLIADESLAPGGCAIETRHGMIDARLETQLARITRELLEAT
jgi:flagellar assembly protein FliH